jgi:hypothetical protein
MLRGANPESTYCMPSANQILWRHRLGDCTPREPVAGRLLGAAKQDLGSTYDLSSLLKHLLDLEGANLMPYARLQRFAPKL